MGRRQKGKRRRQGSKEATPSSVTGSEGRGQSEEETSVEMPETQSTQLTLSPPPVSFIPRGSKIPHLSANARLSGHPLPNYSDTRIPRLSASLCTSLTCSNATDQTPSPRSDPDAQRTMHGVPKLRTDDETSLQEVPTIRDREKAKAKLPVSIIAAVGDMQIGISFGVCINDEDVPLTATVPGAERGRA